MAPALHPFGRAVSAILIALALAACGAGVPSPPTSNIHVDEVEVVNGVPDDGRDPATVAIEVGDAPPCTGVIIATNAVLTARHCVSVMTASIACPSNARQVVHAVSPPSILVYSGNDPASWQYAGRGAQIFVPEGDSLCGADVAVVVLDGPVTGIKPLEVSELGAVAGGRVRSVGYGKPAATLSVGTKVLREHVGVLDTTVSEFEVAEATCQSDSGGPALDETTGAVFGVVSRPGLVCDGPGSLNIYTRVDAFYGLIESALAIGTGGVDAGAHAEKLTTDIGSYCRHGNECGAGVCVSESNREYCSRSCGGQDKCPTDYSCLQAVEGPFVCVEH
jgi:hypothetical protein